MVILPYKLGSRGAKTLAQELGCLRVRPDTFKNRRNHTIVNWGWGGVVGFDYTNILNNPRAVAHASNKLLAFRAFKRAGVTTPEWTTERRVAIQWDTPFVARTQLRGHSGAGIYMYDAGETPCIAPLYVKYVKKQDEYRYHVFNGKVIDVQQKRKRRETPNEEVNYQVRNKGNGWVYCRDGVTTRHTLADLAIASINSLGLDFGAVDIIWNEHQQQGYVLEVNTACGLDGSTVGVYADAIRQAI